VVVVVVVVVVIVVVVVVVVVAVVDVRVAVHFNVEDALPSASRRPRIAPHSFSNSIC
jgi:hypothetical protein